jgi:hypothetical protein
MTRGRRERRSKGKAERQDSVIEAQVSAESSQVVSLQAHRLHVVCHGVERQSVGTLHDPMTVLATVGLRVLTSSTNRLPAAVARGNPM